MIRIPVLVAAWLCLLSVQAQNVGINTTTPDPSAILELRASDAGFLPPRLTTAQRNAIATPAEGLVIYNTDTKCLNFYNASQWIEVCSNVSPCVPPPAPVASAGTDSICEGLPLSLTATNVTGATYIWNGPGGYYTTEQNPTRTPMVAGYEGDYRLKVFLAGCYSDEDTIAVAMRPSGWRQLTGFPAAQRELSTGFVLNGKAYLGYGRFPACAGPRYNDWYSYDPATDTWDTLGAAPGTAREGLGSFAIGSYGYVSGGLSNNCSTEHNQTYRYDPATDTWTAVANHPFARCEAFANGGLGSYGYYGIGRSVGACSNAMYRYDPATNTWPGIAAFPGAGRMWNCVFTLGGQLYLGLGRCYYNSTNYTDFYRYDPATNTWTARAAGPAGSIGANFSIGTNGYLITPSRVMYKYSSTANTWSTMTCPYPGTAYSNVLALEINGKGYVFDTYNKTTWEFTP